MRWIREGIQEITQPTSSDESVLLLCKSSKHKEKGASYYSDLRGTNLIFLFHHHYNLTNTRGSPVDGRRRKVQFKTDLVKRLRGLSGRLYERGKTSFARGGAINDRFRFSRVASRRGETRGRDGGKGTEESERGAHLSLSVLPRPEIEKVRPEERRSDGEKERR